MTDFAPDCRHKNYRSNSLRRSIEWAVLALYLSACVCVGLVAVLIWTHNYLFSGILVGAPIGAMAMALCAAGRGRRGQE